MQLINNFDYIVIVTIFNIKKKKRKFINMETTVRYYSLAPSSTKNNKYYLRSNKDPNEQSIRSANSIGKRLPVTARCNYLLTEQTKNDHIKNYSKNLQQNYLIRTYFSPNKITQETVLQEIKDLKQKNKETAFKYNFYGNVTLIKNESKEQMKEIHHQEKNDQNKNSQILINNQEKDIKNDTPNTKSRVKQRESRLKAFMNKIHNRESQNIYQEKQLASDHAQNNTQIKMIKSQLKVEQQEPKLSNEFIQDVNYQNFNEGHQNNIKNIKSPISNNKVQVFRYQSKQKIPKKLSPKKMKTQTEQYQTESIQISGFEDSQLYQTQKLIQFYSQELKKSQQINTMLKMKITQEQQKKMLFNLTCLQREETISYQNQDYDYSYQKK